MIEEVEKLGQEIGITKACQLLIVPRSHEYRARKVDRETRKPAEKSKPHHRSLARMKRNKSVKY